jgi:hypothetical protein
MTYDSIVETFVSAFSADCQLDLFSLMDEADNQICLVSHINTSCVGSKSIEEILSEGSASNIIKGEYFGAAAYEAVHISA